MNTSGRDKTILLSVGQFSERRKFMEDKNIVQTTKEKYPDYEKKIGNTCYQVNYYFNQNSSMTMQEKVMKIMKAELDMEVRNPA